MSRQRRARRDAQAHRTLRRRVAPLLVVVVAAGTAGTAFTAGLSLPPVAVGVESEPWPSFSASAVTFDDATTPTSVTFTITPTAAQARARTGGTAWSTCAATGTPDQWTCAVTGGTSGFEFVATP